MKYYIIAGEASGDLHGSNLIKSFKEQEAKAEFRYFGGDLMQAQGGTLVKHYAEMAFMGFVEVIANIGTILSNLKIAKQDILLYQPDVLILIDFPGFNLKIAEFAKKNNIRVFYYISPKVWAWNQKRVLKIKKVVNRMFCILPFEVEFYKSWGMEVDYVGNPILDAIEANHEEEDFTLRYNLKAYSVIALLPGSRKQELNKLLPVMMKLVDRFPSLQFVIAGAPNFTIQDYEFFIKNRAVQVIFGNTYNLLNHSSAAIVASGTATLETALLKVPQVVVYKGNAISIAIARMLVKIRFISLVNLIMDEEIVKELIQEDCTAEKLQAELNNLLHDPLYHTQMLINYDELETKMGDSGASSKAARLMLDYLKTDA